VRSHPDLADLTERDVRKAFSALAAETPKLFANYWHGGSGTEVFRLERPTGEARRRLNLWPKPEDRRDQIVQLLEVLAAKTTTREEKEALSRTAKILRGAGGLSGQFITGVASGLTGTAITG
jgi:hypothetical protein